MKYLVLLSLLTLCSCASVPSHPSAQAKLAWDLDPTDSLAILVNDQPHSLFKHTAPYQYQRLQPSEFADYHIPSNASIAVMSWHAGAGDVVYAVQKANAIVVYQREMDESEGRPFPAKKIATFPWENN